MFRQQRQYEKRASTTGQQRDSISATEGAGPRGVTPRTTGKRFSESNANEFGTDSRRFMTEELGTGEWHRQILQEDFYPDFVSMPQQYREDN